MDEFYFKKYSRYVKDKERITLFLTLKNLKRGCMIDIIPRYEKSLIRILHYYKMNYFIHTYEWNNKKYTSFFISKKSISEEEKKLFQMKGYSKEMSITLGKFLGYPFPMDMNKVNNDKDGTIQYYFILDKKDWLHKEKKKEQAIVYRVPENKINGKMIKDSKNMLKKYKKCIKTHLSELYPNFDIELMISM